MIPTPLFVRRTEWEGRPTWTVAVRITWKPEGGVATRSFWNRDMERCDCGRPAHASSGQCIECYDGLYVR